MAKSLAWTGAADADLVIKNNHLFSGATAPAGNSSGTTIGGTEATLFVDAGSGNFTPQGALLDNPKAPVLVQYGQNIAYAPAGA